jgi:ABC-type Fe3+ transport system permease subunit
LLAFCEKKMKDKGKALAIWGCALHVASVVGVVCYTIGMNRDFVRLGNSGGRETGELSRSVGIFLTTIAAGSVVALVAVVLMLVALFGAQYRAIWFRNTLWVLSALWLLVPPIGTGFGICVMVYLVTHNAEFTEQRDAADSR